MRSHRLGIVPFAIVFLTLIALGWVVATSSPAAADSQAATAQNPPPAKGTAMTEYQKPTDEELKKVWEASPPGVGGRRRGHPAQVGEPARGSG